jgi:hypothetical protein
MSKMNVTIPANSASNANSAVLGAFFRVFRGETVEL